MTSYKIRYIYSSWFIFFSPKWSKKSQINVNFKRMIYEVPFKKISNFTKWKGAQNQRYVGSETGCTVCSKFKIFFLGRINLVLNLLTWKKKRLKILSVPLVCVMYDYTFKISLSITLGPHIINKTIYLE